MSIRDNKGGTTKMSKNVEEIVQCACKHAEIYSVNKIQRESDMCRLFDVSDAGKEYAKIFCGIKPEGCIGEDHCPKRYSIEEMQNCERKDKPEER